MHFLRDFDFKLPLELIANRPATPRDSSRLLHIYNGRYYNYTFRDLPKLLLPGDVLVLNDTKVIPVLLQGLKYTKLQLEQPISVTLVRNITDNLWQILAKPQKKLRVGDVLYFNTKGVHLSAEVIERVMEDNSITIRFRQNGPALWEKITAIGQMPLPPYVRRTKAYYNHSDEMSEQDKKDYQTVYATKYGSIAAPTAGLHFTEELLAELKLCGINICNITLHIGLGTFLPVRCDNINDHKMHSESFFLPQKTCDMINNAKRLCKKIICVGTTSLRVLEACGMNMVLQETSGSTNLFIKPGYQFKIADAIITNFHMPKSTLFILVCAFCGRDNMINAYNYAIEERYRFFSYGDSCLLERGNSLIPVR